MRALIIGETEQAELQRIKQYAEAHPYDLEAMVDRGRGKRVAPGELSVYRCLIPVGFKVVFSVEDHPQRSGKTIRMRHLSVSVSAFNKLPSPEAVQLIMDELGFKRPWQECHIDTEKFPGGQAITVIEPFD
jgi:hypothetical protein